MNARRQKVRVGPRKRRRTALGSWSSLRILYRLGNPRRCSQDLSGAADVRNDFLWKMYPRLPRDLTMPMNHSGAEQRSANDHRYPHQNWYWPLLMHCGSSRDYAVCKSRIERKKTNIHWKSLCQQMTLERIYVYFSSLGLDRDIISEKCHELADYFQNCDSQHWFPNHELVRESESLNLPIDEGQQKARMRTVNLRHNSSQFLPSHSSAIEKRR
jgi:hypothetical protein